jgi:hypothetical protein
VRDQRRHARKKVSIDAHLFIRGEKPAIIPCNVVDISEGGARVKIGVLYDLPSEVFLVKDEAEIIYECETVWQKKRAAGLMFRDLCAHSKLQRLLDEMWGAQMIDRHSAKTARQPRSL